MAIRKAIDVFGIVQGVGFRPCVYHMAEKRHLTGTIANTSGGVAIEVQGAPTDVEEFVDALPREVPRLARITGLEVRDVDSAAEEECFRIVLSRDGHERDALVLPDVAVCDDCLAELFDPWDRRYRYPFINCTNCGPRYTIVRDIPYDRPLTSMGAFPMCAACRLEYEHPGDRRFHAQATCCPKCGPHLQLLDRNGRCAEIGAPIAEVAARLHEGAVVAIKGLGGFHLAVDATNAAAVELLRRRKRRVEKPFAVMVPDIARARRFCEIGEQERELLTSVESPIVLMRRRDAGRIATQVAPFNRDLGLFLPYTPLHTLLFDEGGFDALVMTSGNLSEEPIAYENDQAIRRLRGLADWFLLHDRDIRTRCDDSVVRVVAGRTRPLRLSRGYVPVPLVLKNEVPHVLAVGGELKNTICLTKGRYAFSGHHVGDLENVEAHRFFERSVEHLTRILGVRSEAIAYDLHPDYFSTRWALAQDGVRTIGVQHHHAHIASCMAENHLDGRVIGFSFDGTGYGTDGCVWGGEVLLAGYAAFERLTHLEYVPLPGGEAAIREPWRMAIGYLAHHYGRTFLERRVPFVERLDRGVTDLILRMVQRRINSPLTSSCGRLFDAVASLCGVRETVNYEAQAAIELEMAIEPTGDDSAYPFEIEGGRIGTRPLFDALLDDLERGVAVAVISRRFHHGLVEACVGIASAARGDVGLDRVCLSGGTFQNAYLLARMEARLTAQGFDVFSHTRVPAGDGGLSLGQAMVAAARMNHDG